LAASTEGLRTNLAWSSTRCGFSRLISEQGAKHLPEQGGALRKQVEQVSAVDPQCDPAPDNTGSELEIDSG